MAASGKSISRNEQPGAETSPVYSYNVCSESRTPASLTCSYLLTALLNIIPDFPNQSTLT